MKSILTVLLGIACLSVMPCEAKAHVKKSHQAKKSCVDPRDIRVTKDGIFVLEKGSLVPVKTLSRDKGGVYTYVGYPEPYYIHCKKCNYRYNWYNHTHCPVCRYEN
jgi:hypothetical protein